MILNSSIRYVVKLYNTKTKVGMITAIEFRKKGQAESFVKQWKAQGEPFDAELITKEN